MQNKELNTPWIIQRADPYVYLHTDGWYYFTASIPSYEGIPLRRARDLDDLPEAEEVIIWHKHDSGPMSYHVWAPELHHLEGVWYIYFAAGDVDHIWDIRPYVLACHDENPMTGKWIEMGMMQAADEDEFSFKAFSLDGTVFVNKGKHYYIWAEKVGVGKQISNLYIAEMASPTKLKTVQVLLTTPDYTWERKGYWVNEGPAIIKHAGKIYMTYSASDTGENYCIGMLSIDENADMLDPKEWKKVKHPVLQSSEQIGVYGPGHNSFTYDQQGQPVMVYHFRTEKVIEGNPLYNPNRHARLMKIKWGQNGEPQFSYE